MKSAAAKAFAAESRQLIQQRHGGALLPNGQLGNAGGISEPKIIRERLRKLAIEKALPKLMQTLELPDASAVTNQAADIVLRHALPKEIEDVTPVKPATIAAAQLLEAIPRILAILPGSNMEKAKMMEAVEADFEIVA